MGGSEHARSKSSASVRHATDEDSPSSSSRQLNIEPTNREPIFGSPTHIRTLRTIGRLRSVGYKDKDFERLFSLTKEDLAVIKTKTADHRRVRRASTSVRSTPVSPQAFIESFRLPTFADDDSSSDGLTGRTISTASERDTTRCNVVGTAAAPARKKRAPMVVRVVRNVAKTLGHALAPVFGPIP
ncbi:hypothetical protein J8273_7522 [Carpediemonas membranifera]|uniref:Uncharacterized protein n=1 Tax=Carpediemonas membranifera TaxID=201153 RepID=A0A8J6AY29_9EUKA|nr:hypothetical protein J8273_7522 [Carpediemonas membranifera]|eukprot:KAG9391248.1 hypothetical protein J8273_7522 [Carpediemonas membranifera]